MMESLVEEDDGSMGIEEFDTNLPATHSYLPGGMTEIRGRTTIEAGWEGKVVCRCHDGVIFPGESIPMHIPRREHFLCTLQQNERLFGLLFPDDSNGFSGYGVLCEIIELTNSTEDEGDFHRQMSFKAQARHRFRLISLDSEQVPFELHKFINGCHIKILPDMITYDPLQGVRMFSHLRQESGLDALRRADSLITPWPHFVYERFNIAKIAGFVKQYFRELSLENFPEDYLSLSYWVASNLTISLSDHLSLFKIDNALLRLYMELKYCQKNKMYCSECALKDVDTEISSVRNIIQMSKEGLRSNYCNVGGYVHGVVTVKEVSNILLQGMPSREFTWFPGYYWRIAICAKCYVHLGWKFMAIKKSLRPQFFWGLTRCAILTNNSAVNLDDDQ